MAKETVINKNGIGFVSLLQIAFIVLKLCKIISWSWWLVMLPFLINGGLLIIGLLLIIIGTLLKRKLQK